MPSSPSQALSEESQRIQKLIAQAGVPGQDKAVSASALLQIRKEVGILHRPPAEAKDTRDKEWYKAALAQNGTQNPVAWFLRGIFAENHQERVTRLEAAARQNQPDACEALADLINGETITPGSRLRISKQDALNESISLYKKAAAGGRASAAYRIGGILEENIPGSIAGTTPKDTAFAWYLAGAKAGHRESMTRSAWFLQNKGGTQTEINTAMAGARKLASEAHRLGDPKGSFLYAILLLNWQEETNPAEKTAGIRKASEIFSQLAIEEGECSIPSAYWAGICGTSFPEDITGMTPGTGSGWLRHAASLGYIPAIQRIAYLETRNPLEKSSRRK